MLRRLLRQKFELPPLLQPALPSDCQPKSTMRALSGPAGPRRESARALGRFEFIRRLTNAVFLLMQRTIPVGNPSPQMDVCIAEVRMPAFPEHGDARWTPSAGEDSVTRMLDTAGGGTIRTDVGVVCAAVAAPVLGGPSSPRAISRSATDCF